MVEGVRDDGGREQWDELDLDAWVVAGRPEASADERVARAARIAGDHALLDGALLDGARLDWAVVGSPLVPVPRPRRRQGRLATSAILATLTAAAAPDAPAGLRAERLKELLRFALAAVRLTRRADAALVERVWKPAKLAAAREALAASERFASSTGMLATLRQLEAVAGAPAASEGKRGAFDAGEVLGPVQGDTDVDTGLRGSSVPNCGRLPASAAARHGEQAGGERPRTRPADDRGDRWTCLVDAGICARRTIGVGCRGMRRDRDDRRRDFGSLRRWGAGDGRWRR